MGFPEAVLGILDGNVLAIVHDLVWWLLHVLDDHEHRVKHVALRHLEELLSPLWGFRED